MSRALQLSWVDHLPSWLWFALPTAALMPVWRWSAARLLDGSDDPLGIIALVGLVLLVARERAQFSYPPRLRWLIPAMLLTAMAVVSAGALPALVRGVLAVFGVCSVLLALRHPTQPMLAFTGLSLLALPILSSLQFFVGFPLRVVTAEVSSMLLAMVGVDATRSGSALLVNGQLVMVDAPCSGIHMAWVAYFTACVAAAWWRVPDGRFLRRLPWISLTVLGGNIVRNTLLVATESRLLAWPSWTHDAIGLATFAGVAALVLWHVYLAAREPPSDWYLEPIPDPTMIASFRRGVRATALAIWVMLMLWPLTREDAATAAPTKPAIEWPQQYEGRPARPLALSIVERRFADQFPGAIARFTDGENVIVLRYVTTPTRMLHPAIDCYRGLGYRISAHTLERVSGSTASALRRCFIAEKNGQRLRVCEQIVDADGQTFTDTSAWYWAAVMRKSRGPWQTVTTATEATLLTTATL